MRISRIKGTAKILPVYECHKCNCIAHGAAMHIDYDVSSIEEVKATLEAICPDSTHMPVGWAFNGNFHCPSCKRR